MNKDETLDHIMADLEQKKAFYESNKEYGTAAGIAIAIGIVKQCREVTNV